MEVGNLTSITIDDAECHVWLGMWVRVCSQVGSRAHKQVAGMAHRCVCVCVYGGVLGNRASQKPWAPAASPPQGLLVRATLYRWIRYRKVIQRNDRIVHKLHSAFQTIQLCFALPNFCL